MKILCSYYSNFGAMHKCREVTKKVCIDVFKNVITNSVLMVQCICLCLMSVTKISILLYGHSLAQYYESQRLINLP